MGEEYYPDNEMMFAPEHPDDIPEHWQRFFNLREDLLLDYENRNTVRAYWGDLQDWFEWAVDRDKDVLDLAATDVRQYVALLRRRKYSESTVRRRLVVLRLLRAAVDGCQNVAESSTDTKKRTAAGPSVREAEPGQHPSEWRSP